MGCIGTAGKGKGKLRGLGLPWKPRDLCLGTGHGPAQSGASEEWSRHLPHCGNGRLITRNSHKEAGGGGGGPQGLETGLAKEWLGIVKEEQQRCRFFATFSLEEGKVIKRHKRERQCEVEMIRTGGA